MPHRRTPTALAAAVLFLGAGAPASAQTLGLSLGRLRVPASTAPGAPCAPEVGPPGDTPRAYCPDGAAWRRLASELAFAAAAPPLAGADTGGLRRFEVELAVTVARISADRAYWRRGTAGDAPGDPLAVHDGVPQALVVPRLRARKGLPLGLSVEAEVGRVAADAPWWVWGAAVSFTPFEGFRTGAGALPDVAVRLGATVLTGEPSVRLVVPSAGLVLSKPYPVREALVLTPLVAAEALFPRVWTGPIDLTPDVDGYAECLPDPSQPGLACDPATPTPASGRRVGEDLRNTAAFPDLAGARVRGVLGLVAAHGWLTARLTVALDLVAPGALAGPAVPRAWAGALALGARY